ncbi:unnamed protein product [Rhodiola kirilowii]
MYMWWGPEESRRLMEVVLESIKPGVPIAHTWETVAEVYEARSKHVVKPKQVNNHYNNCRSKWVAWNAMNQMTGIALTNDGLPTEIELQSDRMKQFLQKYKAGAYVTKHKLPDSWIFGILYFLEDVQLVQIAIHLLQLELN